MIDGRFGAYVVVATLLIITPGPDTALTIRNAIRFGRRAASMSTLGIALGSLAWGIAAVLGVALLLERSATAFTIFKIAGAMYLAFLGLRSILGSLRTDDASTKARIFPPPPGEGREGAFVTQGLINNLLNPKAGAIFATVFPQFIAVNDSPLRLILMMAAYELILIVWLNIYGFVIARAGRAGLTARFRQGIERVTGAVLVGLGVRLALENP